MGHITHLRNTFLSNKQTSSKLKGQGPGINNSQSKNVGKIQLSMQLSHLSSIFDKRPMGHMIAHLRKQFKSINTYDYIITLIKRRKKNIINFMRIKWFFFEQT